MIKSLQETLHEMVAIILKAEIAIFLMKIKRESSNECSFIDIHFVCVQIQN